MKTLWRSAFVVVALAVLACAGAPPGPASRPASIIGGSTAEVDAQVAKAGKNPPEWLEQVKLNFPATLDLSWPDRPTGQWNAGKNISMYFYSMYTDSKRWREACKFAHHLVTLYQEKGDKHNQAKAMGQLAFLYGRMFGDYARCLYWYRQAAQIEAVPSMNALLLAECYWKVGSTAAALEQLGQVKFTSFSTVKLLGDMGEVKQALELAEKMTKFLPAEANIAAGDVCRFNGQMREAMEYYQKVESTPRRPGFNPASLKRAAASVEALRLLETLDLRQVPDGQYTASTFGFASEVKVEVTVRSGKMESVRVVQQKERIYYNSLEEVPRRIVARQGLKGVDGVTGATITSNAVINATVKALAAPRKVPTTNP